jgi:hypothetical protein
MTRQHEKIFSQGIDRPLGRKAHLEVRSGRQNGRLQWGGLDVPSGFSYQKLAECG